MHQKLMVLSPNKCKHTSRLCSMCQNQNFGAWKRIKN